MNNHNPDMLKQLIELGIHGVRIERGEKPVGDCGSEAALVDSFLKSVGIPSIPHWMYTRIGAEFRQHSHSYCIYYNPLSKRWKAYEGQVIREMPVDVPLSQPYDVFIFVPPVNQKGYLKERMIHTPFPERLVGNAFFKLSLIPFHTWAPDVYEGASAPLAGYMSIVPKIAAIVVAIRIFGMYIDLGVEWVRIILMVLAVLTMTLANIMALVQEDVKRMLAYSSISHAGFVMAALALSTTEGTTGIFLYYALFMFTNLGAFSMLWISRHKNRRFNQRYDHPYEKFSGFIHIMPVGAVIMALFMLSLAGVPPFSIFWGKIYIMQAAVNSGYVWLAIVMGLNSAIAAYYYLKLIVYMFLKDPVKDVDTVYYNLSKPLMAVIGLATVATIGAIFYVQPLVSYLYYMISASGY